MELARGDFKGTGTIGPLGLRGGLEGRTPDRGGWLRCVDAPRPAPSEDAGKAERSARAHAVLECQCRHALRELRVEERRRSTYEPVHLADEQSNPGLVSGREIAGNERLVPNDDAHFIGR